VYRATLNVQIFASRKNCIIACTNFCELPYWKNFECINFRGSWKRYKIY